MKRNYSISVAMATYNGEKYIKDQIDSILLQLEEKDELIISDDGSNDKTLEIINSYDDSRIKIVNGPKMGVIQNFANAIKNCSGRYIFLSDQDDIWIKDKVKCILNEFEKNSNITCILHDCEVFDDESEKILHSSFFKYRKSKIGIIKNIIKNSYIGCCMVIDSKLKDKILPIPDDVGMHDQWIGLLNEKFGKTLLLDQKLIKYRRHSNNVSGMNHKPLMKMIKNRIIFIYRYIKR